jgi:ABC-type antimicrobial peptide transport system permease subunit
MFVLALLSSLYPLWLIWRIRPAEILRAGALISSEKSRLRGIPSRSSVSSLWSLVLRNLARARVRTLLAILSLCLSTLLLIVMFSSILALRQTLTGTLLGDYVLLETAVPQIAGCIFAVLLSFLSVTDLLLLHVRERQREIGLLMALGWRAGQVQRLFIREDLAFALIGAVPGALIAELILNAQHVGQQFVSPLLIAFGAILLMLLVAALASLPALRAIQQMQVHDILRAE